jgi:hypothetical protein
MPNHFLTVGLCGRDWEALEKAEKETSEVDFAPLTGANLCALVKPLPEGLRGIVSSEPPYRVLHKVTREISMDDHVLYGPDKAQWERVEVSKEEQAKLIQEYGASDWYDWQIANWGTKWGTYSLKVHKMGGDGSPILIEFQSAWGPPDDAMMRLIEEYLSKNFYLANFTWVGHDPSNDKTGLVATPQEAA